MKFSGKMWLVIIFRVTKNQGFLFSLEEKFFEKLHGGKIAPPPPSNRFRIKLFLMFLRTAFVHELRIDSNHNFWSVNGAIALSS